jgi:hypothetical protein
MVCWPMTAPTTSMWRLRRRRAGPPATPRCCR